jgi:hypothetical protein
MRHAEAIDFDPDGASHGQRWRTVERQRRTRERQLAEPRSNRRREGRRHQLADERETVLSARALTIHAEYKHNQQEDALEQSARHRDLGEAVLMADQIAKRHAQGAAETCEQKQKSHARSDAIAPAPSASGPFGRDPERLAEWLDQCRQGGWRSAASIRAASIARSVTNCS